MHKVTLLLSEFVTYDVKRYIVTKPKGYQFTPGQATEVAINKPKLKTEKRPFTFTSLAGDHNLEFIIKSYHLDKYPNHRGVTEEFDKLIKGDELLIDDPWGTIKYKGTGVFIAGGAGITPFIAIFRDLSKKGRLKGNKLYFSNKTKDDVILEKELRSIFSEDDLILTITREKVGGFHSGRVDKGFLKKNISNFKTNFYLCGPRVMVDDLKEILSGLGAKTDSLVFEK